MLFVWPIFNQYAVLQGNILLNCHLFKILRLSAVVPLASRFKYVVDHGSNQSASKCSYNGLILSLPDFLAIDFPSQSVSKISVKNKSNLSLVDVLLRACQFQLSLSHYRTDKLLVCCFHQPFKLGLSMYIILTFKLPLLHL